MPYIGKEPEHGNYQLLDALTAPSGVFDGSRTVFNLTTDSVAVYPTSPTTMIISLGGVIQEPNATYTVSGNQITFTTAPATSTTFFGISLGDTLDIGTPSDNSVTVAKMASNSVDSAELVSGAVDRVHLAPDIIDGTKIDDGVIESEHYAAASIDNAHLADNAVDTEEIANDAVTADKLANSINTEIAANTAKVTNATHTGDVTGATGLTIAAGAVDIAHLSASGTKDSTTVLHGNNTFAAVSGIPSGVILMWHGLISNIPSGWVLCNGSNSTPDLRGKFLQGAANGLEANNPVAGGSATAAPGNHSAHSFTQPSAHAALASHQHKRGLSTGTYPRMHSSGTYGTSGSFSSNIGFSLSSQNSQSSPNMLNEAVAAGTPDAHSGGAVDAHSAHSTSDSRPPFYTILYIMKS